MFRYSAKNLLSPVALVLIGLYLGVGTKLAADPPQEKVEDQITPHGLQFTDKKKGNRILIDAGDSGLGTVPSLIMYSRDSGVIINNPIDPKGGAIMTMALKTSSLQIGIDKDGNAVFELVKGGVKTNLLNDNAIKVNKHKH